MATENKQKEITAATRSISLANNDIPREGGIGQQVLFMENGEVEGWLVLISGGRAGARPEVWAKAIRDQVNRRTDTPMPVALPQHTRAMLGDIAEFLESVTVPNAEEFVTDRAFERTARQVRNLITMLDERGIT